jgi:mRNA interferase HicA
MSELVRRLKAMGATFEDGTRHLIVTLNGKSTTLPRHPSKEIRSGTLRSIYKRLGIKP